MAGVEAVAQKIGSYSHVVKERRENPNADMMKAASNRIDRARLPNRLVKVPIDGTFPAYLFENLDRFRHLLSEDEP